MQHSTAWHNTTYTGPTTNVQGLCPEGWRMPTGNSNGDYHSLHIVANLPVIGFWQYPGNWKGTFSGYSQVNSNLADQNIGGYWWSSESSSNTIADAMLFYSNYTYSSNENYKYQGFSIRCLKN